MCRKIHRRSVKVNESGPLGRYIGCTLYSNSPCLYSTRKFRITWSNFENQQMKTISFEPRSVSWRSTTYFCDERLYFKLRKSTSQAHSFTVSKRKRSEWMMLLLITLQPSFWFKLSRVFKIFIRITYDVMLKHYLYLENFDRELWSRYL